MSDIIWPPAPLKSCYLARNLKEVARAWFSRTKELFGRTGKTRKDYVNDNPGSRLLAVAVEVYK